MPARSRDGRYKRFSCLRGNDGGLSADRARGILNIRLSDAHLRGAFLNVSTFLHVRPFVAHDSHACGFADYGDQRSGCGRVFRRRTRQSEVDTAGELCSNGSLVHIRPIRCSSHHTTRRDCFGCDLPTFGISNIAIGHPWQVSYSCWMRGLGCCNMTWENQLGLLSLLHSSFLRCASYVDLSEAAWNSGRARKQGVASMFRFRKCI